MSTLRRIAPLMASAVLLTLQLAPANAQPTAGTTQAPRPAAELPDDLPKFAPIELQQWEKRRLAFSDLTRRLRQDDGLARKEFEMVVRRFESTPFDLTPLEAMDLIGSVFVPQVGVEKMLPLISAQAALGLYDAYRFGSEEAQAQLLRGERFLPRPLTLAGPDQTAKSRKFLQDNPKLAAALVQKGIALADNERQSPAYDARWITAFDRDSKVAVQAAPREEWPAIWARVIKEVTDYYRVEPEQAPAPAAPASAAR